MARKEDCTCLHSREPFRVKEGDEDPTRIYVSSCKFHKGPDKGYGYDEWGRPNGRHSETIGKVGAAIIVVCMAGVVVFLICVIAGAFG